MYQREYWSNMELKCKLCGGRLYFDEGSFSAKCDSCGVSQFIFDYLDKNSDDYDEHVEIIKAEKEDFEKAYLQYADDVINADSYCLTSKDFLKCIDFFEKSGEYKESQALLSLAKICFIKRVSTLSECSLAVKFIDELNDLPFDEKEEQKQVISDLAISFAVVELDQKGFVAILPEERSAENILSVIKKISNAKDKNVESLSSFEIEIVNRCLGEAFDYIQSNCASAVENCDDIDTLYALNSIIPSVKEKYDELKYWSIEDIVAKRIETIELQNQLKEQEEIKEEKKKEAKEKRRIAKSYIILGVILLIISSFVIYTVSGYSSGKVDIAVVSKTNDTFNENLADGQYQAGYFYVFGFEVENNSQHDIKLIGGKMEIFNGDGESLSVSNVELSGELKGGSTEQWNVRLQVDKGDAARELWDSDLSELKITFRIKKIHFEDGPYKSYSKTKNEIIYPQK